MILFNGNNYHQYSSASLPNANVDKTLCMWLNSGDLSGVQGIINAVNLSLGIGYQLGIRTNQLTVWSYGGAILLQTAIPVSTWVHVAYVYMGSTHYFYLNGVQSATSTAAPQSGIVNICQLGGNQWGEYPRTMLVEDVRLYSRALQVSELQTIVNSEARDFIVQNLVHWWPMSVLTDGLTLDNAPHVIQEYNGMTSTFINTALPYPVAGESVHYQSRHPF